jgi:hypothetical protein
VRVLDDTEPTTAKAEHNVIGGALGEAEQKTAACDGPCNVFAATENDIEVGIGFLGATHVTTASGPTTIEGNYLGLSPDGTAEIGEAADGIEGGLRGVPGETGPGDLTIGGSDAAADGNYFDAVQYGVYTEGAAGLAVSGNKFGYAFGGNPVEADLLAGPAERRPARRQRDQRRTAPGDRNERAWRRNHRQRNRRRNPRHRCR